MARFGVAFASNDVRAATLEDLILGVLICSKHYEGFLAFIEQDDFRDQMKAWGARVGLEFDLNEKVAIFNAYLAKAHRQPVVIYEGETSESGAHWAQTVKCALVGPCGYRLSEAMNLPLAQAFADFYKNAESAGVVMIATPEVAMALEADLEGEDYQEGRKAGNGFVPPPPHQYEVVQ